MHGIDTAGLEFRSAAAAAIHVDDLDGEAPGGIEAASLCHPQSQHRIHGLGDADT